MYNLTYTRILHGIKRRIARYLKLHPTSTPYITGDGFRALSSHIHDMDDNVTPSLIMRGDIVFVSSARLAEFIEHIHPQITSPYILITHNGDETITEHHLPLLASDTLIHWFAQNCRVTHPKITPIPIGIENKWYYTHGIPRYFNHLKTRKAPKDFRVLYKFNVATNPKERSIALNVLSTLPIAVTLEAWQSSFTYLTALQSFAFVASPEGNGLDCHRTWEAMYLGTIPIVTDSPATRYFKGLGLPLIVIENWNTLHDVFNKNPDTVYATIVANAQTESLFMDYWANRINDCKTRYVSNH